MHGRVGLQRLDDQRVGRRRRLGSTPSAVPGERSSSAHIREAHWRRRWSSSRPKIPKSSSTSSPSGLHCRFPGRGRRGADRSRRDARASPPAELHNGLASTPTSSSRPMSFRGKAVTKHIKRTSRVAWWTAVSAPSASSRSARPPCGPGHPRCGSGASATSSALSETPATGSWEVWSSRPRSRAPETHRTCQISSCRTCGQAVPLRTSGVGRAQGKNSASEAGISSNSGSSSHPGRRCALVWDAAPGPRRPMRDESDWQGRSAGVPARGVRALAPDRRGAREGGRRSA